MKKEWYRHAVAATGGAFVLVCIVMGTRADFGFFGAAAPGKEQPPVEIDEQKLYAMGRVIDGDTFTAIVGNREIAVRMLGINTPETVDPRRPPECFGREASDAAKGLLAGRTVHLERNPGRELRDKYGRYLLYVYRDDGLFVNQWLIRNGYAREYTVGRPYMKQTVFRSDEKEARQHARGLWRVCNGNK